MMPTNDSQSKQGRIDKRTFLRLAAGTSVGTLAGIPAIDKVQARTCCGTQWPQRYSRNFSAPFRVGSNATTVTSAATHLELFDATYSAGRWRYYFRTKTDIGQVNVVPNKPDAVGYDLNGTHELEIAETVNADALDSYHGSEERNFGVTGTTGPTPNWGDVVFNIGTALVGRWDQRVSDLITAGEIISELAFPGTTGRTPQGIFYNWNVNGEGKVGNWLRWTTEYPPKGQTGNDNHQIVVKSTLDQIPDGATSTSKYTASWTVDLGSMYAPSSMSSKEKDEYGIEYLVHTHEIDIGGGEEEHATHRATNPPAQVQLNSE